MGKRESVRRDARCIVEASRMISRLDRFIVFLVVLGVVGFARAIYDPREATTKPPIRREPVLPWYLAAKDDVHPSEDPSRSPKWQTDPDNPIPKKPFVVDAGTWDSQSPWSGIEQETETTDDNQAHINVDQGKDYSLEYSEFERQENQRFPSKAGGSRDLEQKKNRGYTKNKIKKQGTKNDQDIYEGVPADSMKPRKEKILQSSKSKSTVARYDPKLGVQCPDLDSTGQFVYPPDCKFFVNCWKGRAFVQTCAPGTLFNPDTLECDFPHKVKCYGGEVAEFPSIGHLDSSGRREPLLPDSQRLREHGKLQEPRCPPQMSGLLPHPSNCTKFLQCAHGGTFIMDCGPGTVFNPAVSVCDWPYNVKGCEDALKPKTVTTSPLIPPQYQPYDQKGSEYNKQPVKKVECPSDYTGLLPHPDTCKQFLQCANGVTYIMDCGPGTAFNPSISVCDWPYNVPGCSEETPTTTTPRPWSSGSETGPWQYNPQHNQTWHSQVNRPVTTTSPPKTDWDSLRPTWRPNWSPNTRTTQKPSETNQNWNPNAWKTDPPPQNRYDHVSRDKNDNNSPTQWPHNHGTSDQNPNYDGRYHQHHHYHHFHPHGSDRNIETQQPSPPYDNTQTQIPGQANPDGTWHSSPRYHHHEHHHWSDDKPPSPPNYPTEFDDSDQQTQQVTFDQTDNQRGVSDSEVNHTSNRNVRFDLGNLPANQRTGQEFMPNRQAYGRTDPEFSESGVNRQIPPDRNIYFDNNYDPAAVTNSRNTPGSWNQQGPGQSQTGPQNRPWDKGVNEDKFREWRSRTNIYQSTADREIDSKLNQLASKTNILQLAKGQHRPGVKTLPNSLKPQYPSNIYINANDTWEDLLPKEIEVKQGHSKINTYGPNNLETLNKFNKNDQNIYIDSQATDFGRADTPPSELPAVDTPLRPTYYNPNRQSNGHRTPKQHSINSSPSSAGSGDLLESGTDYHRVVVPSINLQPPYYPAPSQSSIPQSSTNNLKSDNYYPPVPAIDLQPPYYEATHTNKNDPPVPAIDLQPPYYEPTYTNKNDPPVPAIDLQPPYYEPTYTNRNDPPVPETELQPPLYDPPATELQPPLYDPPATELQPPFHDPPATELQPPLYEGPSRGQDSSTFTSTNVNRYPAVFTNLEPPDRFFVPPSLDASTTTNRYPSVPSINLEPPYEENPSSSSPDFVGTTTQRIPDKFLIVPLKKKVPRTLNNTLDNIFTTMDPNVPSVSIEEPDVPASNGNYDVDVLDGKVWKPVLVFENKTQTTTESSVIMKIAKKSVDTDLVNIEDASTQEDEPPFPTYYVPPVEPLDPSKAVYQTTPISGQVVRLRGGSGSHDGYVEVQGTNPGWGVVCDSRNSWTLKEAHVVCKQLGYSRGAEMAWQGRNNRVGTPTWIAANSVSCQGNETRLQLCKFTHEPQCRVERDAIGVRCALNRIAHCRKDEIPYEGQCYHLANPDSSLNHAEALDYCSQRQARLVDITNQAENDFISEWLVQGHPNVTSIMTSGIGFTTINHTIWLWEDSSRAKFRFAKWWPGWMEDKKHPPIVGSRILCVVMKRKFPCHNRPDSICVADYFFWDTEDCVTSMKGHSYICKRPYDDIGCIYGKGSQYAGNANVTASGKQCLSWADEKVRHPLLVNVVNVDVREKLKTHNYCRNLNPKRESRPWCFTGPAGEREYCDIPPCGNIGSPKSVSMGQCKPKHFECLPGECIPSPWVCDGEEDCTNGADERACISYTNLYKKYSKHKLQGYDVEKWLNTPLNTCALRCKEADFTCRSFTHQSAGNVCLLSDSNVGMTGALKPDRAFDYYEMTDRSIDCEGMFVCGNGKCINQTKVCNGKNDCNDRSDENICTVENLDYAIRLAGSENKYEGRIEVKILGVWGQVCDDGFGMINADVICKELGFDLGALEIRPGGFYGNLDPPTRFMVDQLQCRGNETSLRECDFEGWGVHNCQPEEAVGIICKTEVDSCPDDQWKCKTIPTCISVAFICDEVVDCADDSDESPEYCDAPFEVRLANGSSPLEGRVEVRHHGIWGTVCDDDFLNTAATVICRSLGYGGPAVAKKDGAFGSGEGPIWLDEVSCHGNETQLYRCAHNDWGKHNCNHNEDVGVICTRGSVNDPKLHWESLPDLPDTDIDDILPANCGKRFKDFNDDEDLIFEKVVHGTIAPKGTYPWQASIRIRGHSRSSHWCGAVILSPLHVLTAAHCLDGYNKGAYFVRAGDYNTEIDEGTEAEANIEDYYLHDEFRKGHRMNNDIALVLLKGRGIALGKDIMPICLPAENAEYPAGLNCTISGFGSIETGKSTHSKDLRYGWVPLLDQSVCRAEHIYGEGAISDGMVCAGYLDEGTDTCDGDSGGPLACYHNGAFTLYGITSWGKHCGKANKPGVYVRVSHYRRWINQKIRESLAGR
ncbi:uncharacterized protein LOC143150566 isoform X2 [Ptiloglossa arizonensis]|uniref:uncharacterized protein LOC143150566 isoform X2 n=1 Tax=Ptiloglossa arizonensis TaxID=3350558 RepID=UPI003FA1703D